MGVFLVSFPKSKQIKKGKESVPVALLYLSEYLKKNGIACDFIDFSAVLPPTDDANMEEFMLNALIVKFTEQPYLIGLNCFSSYQFPLVMSMAKKIKTVFPDIPICVGGSHPTFFAREILDNCEFIDYVVMGEGEEQLLALAMILSGKSNEKINNIQALGYRDKNGKVFVNPRNDYLHDLNINPRELWGALKFEQYYSDHSSWYNPKQKDIKLAVPIASSRSCPFSCIFCSASEIMGPRLRCRDPENVLDEIEYLNKEHGQNYFEFIDDNINVSRRHAMQIFSGIIKRRLDIQISMASGIHLASADEALINLMVEAGLVMIKMPVEHGNDYIRNQVIGKRLTKEKIFEIARALKKHNIFVFGLFIMGFPEDTPQTLQDSYNLMCELGLDIYEMASLIPFPGTKLFEQCRRDNLLASNLSQEDLWKGTISFDASEHDKIYIKPYNMTIEELQEYRRKFEEIRLFSDRAKGIININ